jgi:voltage-gated potassium channel
MPVLKLVKLSRVPANILSLRVAVLLLISELVLATLGYVMLEGYSLGDAIYMVVITISTVGFTEVQPLSSSGRLFTAILIALNIGIFAYLLAVFTYYIIEGEIFKRMHVNQIEQRIGGLRDHIILCGYGKYGKEIAANLSLHHTPFVVIENDPEKIERIQQNDTDLLYLEGDATNDEMLEKAGVVHAHGLITALSDDSDNLFIVLSSRQLNPSLTIISRAIKDHTQAKLMKAGANHVVNPENIGGFYMATLVNKPGAVEFFSFIINEYHSDISFEELNYKDLPPEYQGHPIRDLDMRRQTGANIIGYRTSEGRYLVNPGPDIVLAPGTSFIVLGSEEQLEKLRKMCRLEKR